jgi:hypothetical protein
LSWPVVPLGALCTLTFGRGEQVGGTAGLFSCRERGCTLGATVEGGGGWRGSVVHW